MSREEAIYELKNAAWLGTDHSRARTEEAVEMAIQALSQGPCTDAVSREAVREILTKYHLGESRIAEELNELSSVQRTSNADFCALVCVVVVAIIATSSSLYLNHYHPLILRT